MNKRKKWGIIALVICIIGGVIMFSLNQQKEKTLEEKMRIEQDRMALYLVSHYEKVEKIEFTSFQQNKLTGTWTSNAIVNDEIFVTFSVQNLMTEDEIGFGQHISQSNGNKLIERENPEVINSDSLMSNITVIYWVR
ncbi:hypothetical protein I6L85_10335 [Streptococcus gordonii]|uniref:hypothetical protein n=1 Tax=Streptococcus TaxID=1301 RepID=UPI0001BB5ECB|nr:MULTISPECIES: hypothetical protein [Streptococcus]EEY79249.1 hypothetical protein HMPREF0847_02131 [Streptococcus sp. 2_1_36FAA]MBZ2124141.1 hypothetical protein [Streptococcus gordonii]MCB6583124.1 hypothetical protein [Streptococcus gordonii]MCB7053856.1 hypothetical protein [Streptococcus gordonii]MCB7055943.1 hypothetical protein [Streptococcus gordonii]